MPYNSINLKLVYGKKDNQNTGWLWGIGRVIYRERAWRIPLGDATDLYPPRGLVCKVKMIQKAHQRYVEFKVNLPQKKKKTFKKLYTD